MNIFRNTRNGEERTLNGLGPAELNSEQAAQVLADMLELMINKGLIDPQDALDIIPGGWMYEPSQPQPTPSKQEKM